MIALCSEHHGEADDGHYSPDELRALKNKRLTPEAVRGEFPSWEKPNLLLRVGGSYFGGCKAVISIAQEPIIELTKNEVGMLSLSFVLRNEAGEIIVAMHENAFDASPGDVHDLDVATRKGRVRVWLARRDIGLDLSFKRLTLQELEIKLSQDHDRCDARVKGLMDEMEAKLPPEVAKMFQEARSGPRRLPPGAEDLPDEIKEAFLSDDQVGHRITSWASRECLADDDRIPFLDFHQLAVFHHGERTTIRDGIGGIDYNAFIDNYGGVNLPCMCAVCRPAVQATK